MVVIKSHCTIVPAEPTPNVPLPLSDCDQSKMWSLAPTIYVYPPNHSFSFSQAVDTLKLSLSRALVPFYPLAGRLRWIGGGRLEIVCNATGAEFVVAESESTLDEFGDFDPTDKIKPLLPRIDYDLSIEKLPAMSVRVTRFACGGITIGLAVSHVILDGASAMHFIKSWTKLARGETLDESDVPVHDRTVLMSRSPRISSKDLDVPVEWKPLPLLLGHSDTNEEREKETTIAMLKLTKNQVEQLKNRANRVSCTELSVPPEHKPYTRFESISSHIWVTACKARGLDHNQPTVFMTAGDCRTRMNPPLPTGYVGNANVRTITDPTCVSGDIVTKPLSYAAGKIREAVGKITDAYMRTTLAFTRGQDDVSWMRSSFHGGAKKGAFLGNPNMFMTSWIGLAIRDADFGWGKAAYMGMGALSCDGKCFVFSGSEEDGSLVVALRLRTDHMGLFRKFFYQDMV